MMKNVRVGLEEAEESLKELNQQPLGALVFWLGSQAG